MTDAGFKGLTPLGWGVKSRLRLDSTGKNQSRWSWKPTPEDESNMKTIISDIEKKTSLKPEKSQVIRAALKRMAEQVKD